MGYELQGRLLEVCTCNVICPCWVGEDPDGGKCDGLIAWHIDQGSINGVDVSGLTVATLNHIPGNVLKKGTWRTVVYLNDTATPQQQDALLQVWTWKLGGPVADLIQLVGEVMGLERVPIDFRIEGGKGTVRIGSAVEAELVPLQGATGATTLHDSVFSTIPGSPAFLAKAPVYRAKAPNYGFEIELQNRNAVQGDFRFVA